jgi:hypothetical protein
LLKKYRRFFKTFFKKNPAIYVLKVEMFQHKILIPFSQRGYSQKKILLKSKFTGWNSFDERDKKN